MSSTPSIHRPILLKILFFNLLACLTLGGGVFWIKQQVTGLTAKLAQAHPAVEEIKALAQKAAGMEQMFWPYFVPALALFFIILSLLTWWSVSRTIKKRMIAPEPVKASRKPKADKAVVPPEKTDTGKRLYLHLMAVLQKEGRLLDFFSEDLTQYQDAQIGAAVRNIHENCKKVLKTHISPQFVLEQNEGDEITVEKDFDPNTLKLVGNVTGTPPFKGVVRHRGWRARKLDLPTFSGEQPPGIIAPAEVEIQ